MNFNFDFNFNYEYEKRYYIEKIRMVKFLFQFQLHISIAKFLDKKEFLYLTIFCIFLIY